MKEEYTDRRDADGGTNYDPSDDGLTGNSRGWCETTRPWGVIRQEEVSVRDSG